MKREVILLPIRRNSEFFVFMFLLGAICIYTTEWRAYLPFHLKLYAELFLDLYISCCCLSLLRSKIRAYVSIFLSLILYLVAFVDIFCYVRFGSPISPNMLRLILETNTKEASEFATIYLNARLLLSPLGLIFLLCICHISIHLKRKKWMSYKDKTKTFFNTMRGAYANSTSGLVYLAVVGIITIGCLSGLNSKRKMLHLFCLNSLNETEDFIAVSYADKSLYIPVCRLVFSFHASRLVCQQVVKMAQTLRSIYVDSCSFSSPNIILIIGESYNRNHSQLYGYSYPTTPRQVCRAQEGNLFAFDNAVTPFNLTSEVFKNSFSLNDLTFHEEWCDKPLFTAIFKKAGYHVSFFSNQFVRNQDNDIFNFSGGMFLDSEDLSHLQFDCRNDSKHAYDEMLLDDYKKSQCDNNDHHLIIFSLLGQHVGYSDRFPRDFTVFSPQNYQRKDLTTQERQIIADYDNATLYNDYVVDLIIHEFEDKDAIVIYMPDHGEECYDGIRNFGRLHHNEITPQMAKNEYTIPFWIWCSPSYIENHQDIVNNIRCSIHRRFYSDDLGHLLLYLGGISHRDYRPQRNVISPEYDEQRLRLLRRKTNYDEMCVMQKKLDLP